MVLTSSNARGESNRVCFLGANNVGKSPTSRGLQPDQPSDKRARDEIPGRSAPQAQVGKKTASATVDLTQAWTVASPFALQWFGRCNSGMQL